MKAKKAKEQLMAIAILSSVFIFFIYLKVNPEMNINSNNQNEVSEIIEQKIQEVKLEIVDSETEEATIEVEESISLNSEEEESIVLFTERELKRAKAYLDKDWRPDDTINLAAWEYVSKNPSINNGQENKTLFIESNQVVNATK
jgi:preprotein translocase subunit SecF